MNRKRLNCVNCDQFGLVKFHLFTCLKTLVVLIVFSFLASCSNSTGNNNSNNGMENDPPPEPPPIIVKSGSFIFEADGSVTEPTDSTLTKEYKYTVGNFSIKSIWVCHFNFIKPISQPCKQAPMITPEVKVWFDDHSGGTDPDATAVQNGNDFLLTVLDKKLSCKKTNKPTRPNRCRNEDVYIQNFTVNGEPYQVNEGDIYTISFYNK